jgi:hypothetical protein
MFINYVLSFLISFLQPFTFKLVGEVNYGELILPLLALRVLPRVQLLFTRRLALWVLFGLTFYLVSLIFSDLYRGSLPEDFLRGWMKIVVMGLSFVTFFCAISQNENNLWGFVLGYFLSFILSAALTGNLSFNSETFKWQYSYPIAGLVFYVSGKCAKNKYGVSLFLTISLMFTCFFMNFRSMAGIVACSIGVLLWSYFINKNRKTISPFLLLIGGACAVLFFSLIMEVYTRGASSGFFGEKAKQKFVMQSDAEGGFDLLSGRGELLFALPKIIESPLIGWGSWAKDEAWVLNRAYELRGPDTRTAWITRRGGLIPTHSHLINGWIESGIFGAVFWIVVIWIVIRNVTQLRPALNGYWSLFAFISILMLWDLFFSPFGGNRRVFMGFLVAWQIYHANTYGGYNRIFQLKQGIRRKVRA